MLSEHIYDVIVIGGGAVGLGAAYECAKADRSTLVLEKGNLYNSAGSSGDLARMFRTMYTEDYMAKMAKECMAMWDELEDDAGETLRLMTGLLNFGDPTYGAGGPEGTLLDPIKNLEELGMPYKKLTKAEIEKSYPFKNLPDDFEGVFAPDNGIINVPLLLRTLSRLAQSYGARLLANTTVHKVRPHTMPKPLRHVWKVETTSADGSPRTFIADKLVLACGAYVNDILVPSFNFHLKLDIWEMVASYFGCNPGPKGTVFPSMWFQFANDDPVTRDSGLYYGFPALPWGPPNLVRIAVDAATRRISDPSLRRGAYVSPEDVEATQRFISARVKGVDESVPASSFTCLQTNVYDNMFVLDYLPARYVPETHRDTVAVFTAGWAMKFIPLLGRALKEMVFDGGSKYARDEFKIDRHGETPEEVIIVDGPVPLPKDEYGVQANSAVPAVISQRAGKGSSIACRVGH